MFGRCKYQSNLYAKWRYNSLVENFINDAVEIIEKIILKHIFSSRIGQ